MKKFILKYICQLSKMINFRALSKGGRMAQFHDKVLAYDINHTPYLEDYQKNDTLEILKIIYENFKSPRQISVLDVGCSAEVTRYLASHVKSIIGINIDINFLNADACPKNAQLLPMDATQLTFPDQTFDFVFSANLYEHIGDLSKCIDEQLRVLKKGGLCYTRWEPLWSSRRGHHIHEDMVRWWEKGFQIETSIYKNDGHFIGDWSHLILSKDEMFENLLPKLHSNQLVKQIVDHVYFSGSLNRKFFDEVKDIFFDKKMQIISWEKDESDVPQDILQVLQKRYKHTDFRSRNSQILFTHAEASPSK